MGKYSFLKRLWWRINFRRRVRWFWQRRTRGWDDRELWNLDCTIAKFILPRLKHFRNNLHGYPSKLDSIEEWEQKLDLMIFAFERTDEFDLDISEEDSIKIKEGLLNFAWYFECLWD